MMRRLTAREQKIFMFSLMAVIISFFFNFILRPIEEQKEFLSQEIEISQGQLRKDLRMIEASRVLDERHDSYVNLFRRSATEEAVSAFLSEIETVADQFGLRVMDLKPGNVEKNEYGGEFSVSLTINSEFTDIIRFLYVLQQPPYLFDVAEVEFEKFGVRDHAMLTTRLVLGRIFILRSIGEKKPKMEKVALFYGNGQEKR